MGARPKVGLGGPPALGGGRNADADFHGEGQTNQMPGSTTDVDSRLRRKGSGKDTKLCFMGNGLMENRHELLVDACLSQTDGYAERVAALRMIEPRADRDLAGRRPSLRHRRFNERTSLDENAAPCGADHQRPAMLIILERGKGKIPFGARQAGFDTA